MMKLPEEPKQGFLILEWCRYLIAYLRATRITSVVGGKIRETASGSSLEILFPPQPRTSPTKPPLWITLRAVPAETQGDPPTWEVVSQYGHVVPRNNAAGDAGEPITITSLPTNDAPLAVEEDEKLYVKETISTEGKVTAALFEKATSWPTDSPPDLQGGGEGGSVGYRYTRIAEIIANPESTATPPTLIRNQLHTGHITAPQPTLSENVSNSMSSGEARVLKRWNASAGRWDFRYLEEGPGITITENADTVEIKVDNGYAFATTHPWKVTNAGGGIAAIAAGFINGYYFSYSDANPGVAPSSLTNGTYGPDTIVKGPISSYAGGTAAITGTQYIYAITPKNGTNDEYSESFVIEDTDNLGATGLQTIEIYDLIDPIITDAATIDVSSTAPDTYAPASGTAAVCIAKVTNTAGTITVDAQYVTHNPDAFVPVIGTIWEYPP